MATTVNLTSSYAGEAAMGILTPMFRGLEGYAKTFTVWPNVDTKMPLVKATATGAFREPGQKFNPGGSVTFSEVVLFPQPVEAQWEISKLALRGMWNSPELKSAFNGKVPQTTLNAINTNAVGLAADEFLRLLWNGVVPVTGDPINGIFTQLKSGAAIKPTWAAVTAANVISKLDLVVYQPAMYKVKNTADTYLICSSDVISLYGQAVTAGNNYRDTTSAVPLNYLGYQMIEEPLLPTGTILFVKQGNINIGFNESDGNASLDIIDKEFTTGDKELAITAGFSLDVQIGFIGEVVAYYNPA